LKTTDGCIRAVVYAKAKKAFAPVFNAINIVHKESPLDQYHIKLLLRASLLEKDFQKDFDSVIEKRFLSVSEIEKRLRDYMKKRGSPTTFNLEVRLFSTSKPDDNKSIPKTALVLIHLKLQDTEGNMEKEQNRERPSPEHQQNPKRPRGNEANEAAPKKTPRKDTSATAAGSSGEGGASTAAGEEAEATRTSAAVGASVTGGVSKLGGKASTKIVTQEDKPTIQTSGGTDASTSQASRETSSHHDTWGKRRKSLEIDAGADPKKKPKVSGGTPQDQERAGAPGSQNRNPGPTRHKDPRSYSSSPEDDARPTPQIRISKKTQGRGEGNIAARSADNSMKDDEKEARGEADESESSPRETSRDQPTNVEEETSESASSAARGSEQGGLDGSATTQGAQSANPPVRGEGTEDAPLYCDSLDFDATYMFDSQDFDKP
jgi:hypothetical protein